MRGKVYLVGAGPGDPELLTRKALRILRAADVVLHDDLVTPEILALASPAAQVCSVGKRCGRREFTQEQINALMVAQAKEGRTVVRLKGGDPLVFGRAGEEMEALRAAEIEFEVVPGVTAAAAAAAAAQIPLTDRRWASTLIFLTGHRCAKDRQDDWATSISPDSTIVLYMPGNSLTRLAGELAAQGCSSETPCLAISSASTSRQQILFMTLDELSKAPHLPSPTVVVIGRVAALCPLAEKSQFVRSALSQDDAQALTHEAR